MKKNHLLIHDLASDFAVESSFDETIGKDETIKNCIGCFTCWVKTPMKCVLQDNYAHMAEKLKTCSELTIVSSCTYGGPSHFVKTVLDRSIPYLHPDFVIQNGRMHHKQRFPQHISLQMLFYGENLTEEEKTTAEEWTQAMAINFDMEISAVRFYENPSQLSADLLQGQGDSSEPCQRATALINGSPKKKHSTSGKMLEDLKPFLSMESRLLELHAFGRGEEEQFLRILRESDTLIFSFPLYVDGIPGHLLQYLAEAETFFAHRGEHKFVYAIINCGFYEGEQTQTAMKILKNWCARCGFSFCGGLGVGAGGMWHSIKDVPVGEGPKAAYGKHLAQFGSRVKNQEQADMVFTTVDFPRLDYKLTGEQGWRKAAEKNGIDL